MVISKTISINGAENRTRTYDLLITRQLLYRLSYFGIYTIIIKNSIFVKSKRVIYEKRMTDETFLLAEAIIHDKI